MRKGPVQVAGLIKEINEEFGVRLKLFSVVPPIVVGTDYDVVPTIEISGTSTYVYEALGHLRMGLHLAAQTTTTRNEGCSMSTYDGWSISTGFRDGNMFDDTDGVDEEASIDRYVEKLEQALRDAFPGAEIEVLHEEGYGVLGYRLETHAYAPTEDAWEQTEAVVAEVDDICGRVYQDFDAWVVMEKP